MLNDEQYAHFKDMGFVIINNFASSEECDLLCDQAALLVENVGPVVDPRSACKSKTAGIISHAYFEESLNNASLFFDASAVASDGTLLRDKRQSVIKIGHALHDCDPVFVNYSHSYRMHTIARTFGLKKPLIGQSRYFFRLPGIATELSAHQDSTILYTDPPSCYAVWLALDDATVDNGCMWARPKSHKAGVRRRYVKSGVYGKGQVLALKDFELSTDAPFIPLEMSKGSAVIMSGELIHKSGPNRSNRSRRAYTLHFVEGHDSHRYPADNWLQRNGGFRELRTLPDSFYGFSQTADHPRGEISTLRQTASSN